MTEQERIEAAIVANDIANQTAVLINQRRGEINHTYAAQYLLETVIANLQERV